jgi:hypothetical protein
VIGVSAVTKGHLEIRVASKEQAQQARFNARCVRGFGEAARAKAATWYPIKVDGVAREAICKTEGNGWQFREDALQIINESNSREGMKVHSLVAFCWRIDRALLGTGGMGCKRTVYNTVYKVIDSIELLNYLLPT